MQFVVKKEWAKQWNFAIVMHCNLLSLKRKLQLHLRPLLSHELKVFFEASSSTTQEDIEMHDKEKGPSVDIASNIVQLKLAGCGSTIGSGSNALDISVNK